MLLYPSQADNKMTSNAFDTLENLVQATQKKEAKWKRKKSNGQKCERNLLENDCNQVSIWVGLMMTFIVRFNGSGMAERKMSISDEKAAFEWHRLCLL